MDGPSAAMSSPFSYWPPSAAPCSTTSERQSKLPRIRVLLGVYSYPHKPQAHYDSGLSCFPGRSNLQQSPNESTGRTVRTAHLETSAQERENLTVSLFVLPSQSRPLNAPMEAIAASLPCVATDLGRNTKAIHSGEEWPFCARKEYFGVSRHHSEDACE